jgi:phosphoglycolate phosphatase-like HAD superfamily hydrolase
MDYRLLGEGIMVNQRSYDKLAEVEAIIFDCDGTLIDSTESYYLADRIVACIILEKLYGLRCSLGKDMNDVLARLEMLGGFNNDWNKTSLITQAIIMKVDEPVERITDDITEIDDMNVYLGKCMVEVSSPGYVLDGLRWLSDKTSQAYGGLMWLRDFEELIDAEAEMLGRLMRVRELRSILGPLTRYGSGLLTTLYDEVYLGIDGVKERYGVEPRYVSWEGLLERERPLITEDVLARLSEGVPRGIAIATGRGRWETEKALGGLINYFNLEASIFAAEVPDRYEKPDPGLLVECSRRLGVERIMYVGNSLEDLILVENARRNGLNALFTGVLTNPYALEVFIRRGADAIIDDINLLPRLIEKEKEETFWKPF